MLEKNSLNYNIKDIDKDILLKIVNNIDSFFSKAGVDINYDNSSALFQKIKLIDIASDEKDFTVQYDGYNNVIFQNFGNEHFNEEKWEYEYTKTLINIISSKYDYETSRYSSGLNCLDTNLKCHGEKLNDMLSSYISTLITGYNIPTSEKDFSFDSAYDYHNLNDIVIPNILETFGVEEVLGCFINGEGNKFFSKVSSILESEESAINFYNSIDNYEIDPIKSRKIYDVYIKELKEKNLQQEQTPKM